LNGGAGNIGDSRALLLVDVWGQAVSSLPLGISLFYLLAALVPDRPASEDESDRP
jgi:hypothetical protein